MKNESDPMFILAAGMPRSASTWLYNAARLLLCSSPAIANEFSCGWIGDWKTIPKQKYMLIKIHDYNKRLVEDANLVLYSYRDIRDVLASNLRKFGSEPTLALADYFINQNRQWIEVANFIMRYEDFISEKERIVSQLASILGIDTVSPATIVNDIEELNYENKGPKNKQYHSVNLYHEGHMTDGRHGSWKGLIDEHLIKQIEEKHRKWFEEHNYQLTFG